CARTILQNLELALKNYFVILVEPKLSPTTEAVEPLRLILIKFAYERRDVWPSREYAYHNLKSRRRCKRCDPRVLNLYVKLGLWTHPGARHPTMVSAYHPHVRKRCYATNILCKIVDPTKLHFQTMYRELDSATKPVKDLGIICSRIPVSIVFGNDNESASSKLFSSATRIDGAGHHAA
ncbi:uncharacterized protein EDB93DRAFT_1087543, partial [Suillus bovinus]|uniref:uncharacterized protein n=1 Tax=Suillus bovinus TaxID=48563 RepID=UPI001B861801